MSSPTTRAPDAVIRALQVNCDMTALEAIDTWNVIQSALAGAEAPTTRIHDEMVDETINATIRVAVAAANAWDMRAGADVEKALRAHFTDEA